MSATIPNAESVERQVLGAMLTGRREAQRTALDALTPEDFYAPMRSQIFEALQTLARDDKPIDTVLLLETLKARRGGEGFSAMWDEVETCIGQRPSGSTDAHCRHLRNLAASRALITACLRVAAEGHGGLEDPEDFLDRSGISLSEAVSRREDGFRTVSLRDLVGRVYLEVARRKTAPGGVVGVTTGLADLDRVLGGLRPGKVYVFAGRPGMGKSALAQCCVRSAAGAGRNVLVFSLEMANEELGERMMATESNLVASRLAAGMVDNDDIRRLAAAGETLAGFTVEFAEEPEVKIEVLRRAARRSHAKKKLQLVVVDYMQLLKSEARGGKGSRAEEVGEVSRGLKLLAMELQVPVIAVAQLNREGDKRTDKRPMLSELRESGSIEQDADVVIMLYRDDYYNANSEAKGLCELIIAKHRGGATGVLNVTFDAPRTKFGDHYRGE